MTPLDTLLNALKTYGIEVISVEGDRVKLENKYEIEVEANGMYKLIDDGYVLAPFNDYNKLCEFILT